MYIRRLLEGKGVDKINCMFYFIYIYSIYNLSSIYPTLAMLVSIYLCTIVTLQDPSVGSDLCPGMYVAVKSTKYHERPLIGKVCDTDGGMVEIEWMVGTYSGLWK